MKAILLVNLKTDAGTVRAQTKFDDSVEPFPDFIQNNIDNPKVVRLVTVTETPVAPAKAKVENKPKLQKLNKK